jgi:hypothetical protein
MDNLVYEESLYTEVEHSEFISKKFIYVNDNNNGAYSSQIVLDSTSLSNSGGYIGWSEGFILMPLVVQLSVAESADTALLPADTNIADYSWAFKSGFWQMIDSMTVEFNNQNVIQTTPFSNIFRSFKANTTFSCDDIKNHGPSTGYYPDTAGSWGYSSVDTATVSFPLAGRGSKCGISNNANGVLRTVVLPTALSEATANTVAFGYLDNQVSGSLLVSSGSANAPAFSNVDSGSGAQNPNVLSDSPYAINEGMKKRQEWVGYSTKGTSAQSSLGQTSINNTASCQTNYRPCKISSVAGCVSWLVYAKIRLKDLADFFEKTPLLKGSTIRFLINTNQAITKFTLTKGVITNATGAITTQPLMTIDSVTVTGGRTNPLMIASAGFGSGSNPLTSTLTAGTAKSYYLSCSIFKNAFSEQSAYAGNVTSGIPCRLYAPVYTMNPLAESKYLSLAPTKRILYKDIFQYQITNVTGSFNFLVSNGINRIRSVTVVPFVSQANISALNQNINPLTTPCSATPAMPDPIMITNFNILISGMNLFISNELYDFEAFREQLMSANQLNGNLTTGLTSGQISEDDFARGYRYYYGDCSRALPSEENVSRSVQIIGENKSLVACDLYVFVEFMKEITIDLTTGARID